MSSISAGTTSTTTLVHSGDTTGSLVFKTNDTGSGGTTAVTIDTSQRAAFVAGTAALPAITTAGDTNTGIYFPAADTIAFAEGGTEAMRIDSSGNVGIGTSSTSAKLSVSLGGVSTLGQQSNQALALLGGGSNNQLCQIGMGYGTGTTYTPTAIGSITTTQTGNTIADLIFATRSVNTDTAPSERMRISSGGNVLMGVTALNGVGGLSYSNADQYIMFNQTASSSTYIYFRQNGTDTGNIQHTASNTSYNTSSDYRLKDNIAPMTGALSKVTQLKPVTYKWKVDGSDGEGFIAHELAEVCPQAVTGDKDAVYEDGSIKPQSIDTSFLVATLTAAIQELKAINDQQAETINALTARVVALESRGTV